MTGILKALGAIAGTVKIAYGLVRAWSLWMAADAWSELARDSTIRQATKGALAEGAFAAAALIAGGATLWAICVALAEVLDRLDR